MDYEGYDQEIIENCIRKIFMNWKNQHYKEAPQINIKTVQFLSKYLQHFCRDRHTFMKCTCKGKDPKITKSNLLEKNRIKMGKSPYQILRFSL